MTQNGQGPEPQYPAVPPAHDGAHGEARSWDGGWAPAGGPPGGQPLPPAQPLPPEAAPGAADMQSTQYLPPVPPQPGYGYPGPAADLQATQHIPPVPGGAPQPGYGYPQPGRDSRSGYGYPPPAGPDAQATQHIAAVPPQPGGGDSTQFLGTGPLDHLGRNGQDDQGGYGPGPSGASDVTQYIAPVPPGEPGERQPPAEFDSLFRTEAPRTPQPPRGPRQPQGYQAPPPPPAPYQQYGHQDPPSYTSHDPRDAYDSYDDEPAPRRRSPVALIAVVVIGCAVVGLGAGALLSGGDDEKDPATGGGTVASSSATPSGDGSTQEKPADPAEPQARELSKLLATSSSSRDTVISSVAAINQCKDLDKAAADLKGAAEQRRGLVTKLQSLSVDKIPDSAALTAALTDAWKASASADDHYAAWALQAKGKDGCKDGKARSTKQRSEADKRSGDASRAKKKASALWNPTAEKYGLEKRSSSQL